MGGISLEPVSFQAGQSTLPVGAHVSSAGVSFRVWAPDHQSLRVVTGADGFATRYVECARDPDGFFSGRDEAGRAGDRYWYQVDGRLTPDPASRSQPQGVDGASQVIDPAAFAWHATQWRRPRLRGRVIYELHVGAFTREGTFEAAAAKLDALVDLGVNTIELMPLGDFPGRWNWGYDGVMIFAPARCYGTPDELRALIDGAHRRGLAVMVDVVYNHLGPCGNVLPSLSHHYFHPTRQSLWGQALNFDGVHARPVREFFLQNVCMWLDEYRVDGLRLDAVHAIHDDSTPHFVVEATTAAQARGAFVVAEDDRNDACIITPRSEGGWGVDGLWADDFHHTARVALTGQRHAHFSGYSGTIEEWVDTLRHGWFYRGQEFPVWKRPRGTPAAHRSFEQFVMCISNHDQVGNRPLGDRLHDAVTPEEYRAVSMLLCLLPYTPLLFMGQEWASSSPFPYFTDLPGEVGERMGEFRRAEFVHYHAHYAADTLARMPDPQRETTFLSAKLDWTERERPMNRAILSLYRECLHLRGREEIFQSPPREVWSFETLNGSVVAARARDPKGDWLLVSAMRSVGAHTLADDVLTRASAGRVWEVVLSSNAPRFGGGEESLEASIIGGMAVDFSRPVTALLREKR